MEWRDVPGYEGRFQVSSTGKVRSLDRIVKQVCRWGFEIERTERGRMLAIRLDRDGYERLSSRELKETQVHRVVAMAFIPNQYGKPQVNHKNGVTTDNRVENLEWVTNSENHIHAIRVLGRKPNVGPGKTVLLVSPDGISKTFDRVKLAAEFLGVGKTAIMNAAKKHGRSRGWEVCYV